MLGRARRSPAASKELKRALLAWGAVNVSVGAGRRGLAWDVSDDLVSGWISRDEFSWAALPLAAGLVTRVFGARMNIPSPFPLLHEAGVAACGCHVISSSSWVGKLRQGGDSCIGWEHALDWGCDPETPRIWPPAGLIPGEMSLHWTGGQSCTPDTPNIWGIQTPWAVLGLQWDLSRSQWQKNHKTRAASQGGCYGLVPRLLWKTSCFFSILPICILITWNKCPVSSKTAGRLPRTSTPSLRSSLCPSTR